MVLDYVKPEMREATVRAEQISCFSTRLLAVKEYDNAVLYPARPYVGGGVVDASGQYVENTSVYAGIESRQEGAYATADIVEDDTEAVYLGMFYSCWGHCMTDCLQHLWFLHSSAVSERIKKLKFVYSISAWGKMPSDNFFEMLSYLGFDRSRLVLIDRPTRFRKLHIPDSCFFLTPDFDPRTGTCRCHYTNDYREMIERLRARVLNGSISVQPTRKVYFSRSSWRNGREIGEKYIERAFRKAGYEIVRPESLSFGDMVRLLNEVSHFASTDGSCAHNALFLSPGATSIVIRKADYINWYQPPINQMRGLRVVYIDANHSDLLHWPPLPMLGPFFLYVNANLASFLGCRAHFPVFAYGKYLKLFLRTNEVTDIPIVRAVMRRLASVKHAVLWSRA